MRPIDRPVNETENDPLNDPLERLRVESQERLAVTKVGNKAKVLVEVRCTEYIDGGYNFALVEEPEEAVIWERMGSSKITWLE